MDKSLENKASSLWFEPVCTNLLKKIIFWWRNFENGDVFATRDFMSKQGQIQKIPTKYITKVPFSVLEFQYLVLIMKALAPENLLTTDFINIYENMKQKFVRLPAGKFKPVLTSKNEWIISIASYKQDIKDVYEILLKAREGSTDPRTSKEVMEDLFLSEVENGK